jgi:hypothetical protein
MLKRLSTISKEIYGNLTQTDIAMSNRPGVINHLLTNGAG